MFKKFITIIILILIISPFNKANSAGLNIIRDSETENLLNKLFMPIFKASGLPPKEIKIHLVRDNQINAFATPGKNIFINTGLILKTSTPEQLIGVLSHEMGHVIAGHTILGGETINAAETIAILSTVLGTAAAILSGQGELGAAVTLGGQQAGLGHYLSYRRDQESVADQYALQLMQAGQISPKGFIDIMELLQKEERSNIYNAPAYLRTHPLTLDRLEHIKSEAEKSPYKDSKLSLSIYEEYNMMLAKLYAFINPPQETLKIYNKEDKISLYAKAIALHKQFKKDEALAVIDKLIALEPNNPYFYELKGQMNFENGNIREAVSLYKKAISISPKDDLLKIIYASSLIELRDEESYKIAKNNLETALKNNPDTPLIYKLLAICERNLGEIPLYHYYMAEYFLRTNDLKEAEKQAGIAEKNMPYGSPFWLKIQDLKTDLKIKLNKEKKKS